MICKKCSIFATAFQKGKFRDVAQLVAHLVWDQRVARSSRVIPTAAKEVGETCLLLFS